MREFGLIGFPLSHSFSKKYFEDKFQREQISDNTYRLFELKSIEEFPSLIQSKPYLVGLNVTIPYKSSVIDYLHGITDEAQAIGAINCIRLLNGKLNGHNTDVFGFEVSLQRFLTILPDQIFILGTGGSSKAVEYVLKKINLPFVKVSRNEKANCISYEEIAQNMKFKNLFINTTPLGMFPDVKTTPQIPYERLSENDFLFDLVYNPAETEFLKLGKLQGSKIKNGLEMLELQAEKSWQIWNS